MQGEIKIDVEVRNEAYDFNIIEIEISDTGIGISKEKIAKVIGFRNFLIMNPSIKMILIIILKVNF